MQTRTKISRLVAALAVTAAAIGHGTPIQAAGNSVTVWDKYAVDAIVGIAKKPGAAATIDLTLVHAAIYDAVNAIDGVRFKPYASAPPAASWASIDAAVAQAAHDVLVYLYPMQRETLDGQLTGSLALIPEGPEKVAGLYVGAAAADAVIALRTNDGRNDPTVVYSLTYGPGAWQLTPPAFAAPQTPWISRMTPFTMTSPSQFRPAAPPSLTTAEYAKAFNETADKGAVTGSIRTDAQTAQGQFWAEHFATQYSRYLRDLVDQRQLSMSDSARLFAEIDMAAADSFVACWDAKYTYGFWRPVTAIRDAALDGNSGTPADPLWTPLLVTANHPEYPSAHACGSAAITETLASFFGTDRIRTTVTSTTESHPRTFDTFRDLYEDVHESRIYGGMHFRFSMNVGRVIGAKVSRQLTKNYFVPMR